MAKEHVEKLGIWDRIFNRYRKEILEETEETWHRTYEGRKMEGTEFKRKKVKYRVIDRVTGSETISYEFVN